LKNELPTEDELRETAAEFERLLRLRAPERKWQSFLAKHPFVFSRTLSLRIQPWDIVPYWRDADGIGEADFVFFDQTEPRRTFGVIELKRLDRRIITLPRRQVLSLSTDANTAIKQAQEYGRRLEAEILDPLSRRSCLALGNSSRLFVIMGLSTKLADGLVAEVSELQLRNLVPPGIEFIPYDELFRRFESGLPQPIHVFRTTHQRHASWDGRSKLVYKVPGKPPFSIRQHGTAALPPGISIDATTGVVTIPAQP
jgi:hypothetical protein